MIKFIPILFFILYGNISFSQSFDIEKENLRIGKPESENYQAARDLHRALTNGLKKNFNVHNQSIFTVHSYITIGESKTIEAMETLTMTNVEVEFQLENSVTKEIKKWNYEGKGKGLNEYKAISDSFKNFRSANNGLNELTDSVSVYISNELNNNCLAFIRQAEEATKAHDLARALLILNNIKEGAGCESSKKSLKEKITEIQAKEVCDVQIQKIKIMANSTVPKQLDNAVRELLMIPPNAPCSEEAIAISKQIGDHLNARSEKTQELLIKFQTIQSNHQWEEWFDYYLKGKLGGRQL